MTKRVHKHKIVKSGKLQKSESSLICVVIAEGFTNALPVFTSTVQSPCTTRMSFGVWSMTFIELVIEFFYFAQLQSLRRSGKLWLLSCMMNSGAVMKQMVTDTLHYCLGSFTLWLTWYLVLRAFKIKENMCCPFSCLICWTWIPNFGKSLMEMFSLNFESWGKCEVTVIIL